ncbi:hypothetical protein PYCCODRAFT_33298 [Trametes coccinea BRFM310]|uniref:Uncharacterized protein n=1 Tax=Trametes coccinea (strain BRFM310) TaxID=1353009 RepID=A0A1Y2J592_TRAC3|nr:hypothetical protein PYCCODRAFT_33298 [Trametes coccinea BRFM310]
MQITAATHGHPEPESCDPGNVWRINDIPATFAVRQPSLGCDRSSLPDNGLHCTAQSRLRAVSRRRTGVDGLLRMTAVAARTVGSSTGVRQIAASQRLLASRTASNRLRTSLTQCSDADGIRPHDSHHCSAMYKARKRAEVCIHEALTSPLDSERDRVHRL